MSMHPTSKAQLTIQGTLLLEREAANLGIRSAAAGAARSEKPPMARRADAAAATARCSGCSNPISFQPPVAGEPVGAWICKTCGAVYYGDDAASAAANALGVVRAAQVQSNPFLGGVSAALDACIGSVPPEYVQRLVSSLAGDAYKGPERRKDKRYRMSVPVVAVPLGLDFGVAREPVRMTTMNVSLGGAALIHTRYTDAPYFALDFAIAGLDHAQVMLEVLRVRNFGPVYEVAGRFINRLSQTPPRPPETVP